MHTTVILELCNCKHIAHPSQEAPAYSGVLELACRVSHVNMKFVRGLILRVVVTRSDASSRTYLLAVHWLSIVACASHPRFYCAQSARDA